MNRDVLLTVLSRLVTMALLLGAAAIVARSLGPEDQGRYFVAITFAATIVQFANLGLHSSNMYFLARDSSQLAGLLANSFWASLIVGGGAAVALALACQAAGWHLNRGIEYLWLGAAMAPPRMFFMIGSNLLVGLNKLQTYNLVQIGSNLAILCMLSLVGALGGKTRELLGATLVVWIAVAGILMFALMRAAPGPLGFRREIFQAGFHFSAKAYLSCLLAFLVLRSNVFLLQALSGEKEVGLYSIAAQAADVLNILPTSLALVLFPRLAQDEHNGWRVMVRSLWKTAAFMLVACCASAIVAEPAVILVFGRNYLPAAQILWYMLPGAFFLGLMAVVSQYLAAKLFPRGVLDIWAVALIIQTLLSAVLIPRYAGVGAAVSLSVAYGVGFILQVSLACAVAGRTSLCVSNARA